MKIQVFAVWLVPLFVTAVSVPLFQDAESLSPVFGVLKELPTLGVVAWIVFWLQSKHQSTIEKIMTGIVERENKKDETQEKIINSLLRAIEDAGK